MSLLDRVIELRSGGKAVLIMDEVADESAFPDSIRLEEATARHSRIFVQERDLQQARKAVPGVSVYGFWQTVLASKHFDLSHDCYIYESDPHTQGGVVLIVKDGKADTTMPYFGGLPAGIPMRRPYQITEADLAHLVAPRTPALLPEEIARANQQQVRKVAMVCSVIALAAGVLAAGTDWVLAAAAAKRVAHAKQIEGEAAQLEAQVAALAVQTSPFTEETKARQNAMLTRLGELIAKADSPKMALLALTNATDATFEVKKLPTDVSFDILGVSTPAFPLTVTMSLDGSAPPNAPGSPAR